MWKRQVFFFPWGWLAYYVDKLNRYFPGFKDHIVGVQSLPHDDSFVIESYGRDPVAYAPMSPLVSPLLLNSQTQLQFTQEQEQHGKEQLEQIGIPPKAEWICFHARDSAYVKSHRTGGNWSYQNYRDSNIQNYMAAVEVLTQRGYFAFRMGAVVDKPLQNDNDRVIDYALQYRSELMDLYLAKKCRFYILSATGIQVFPLIYRKPMMIVNVPNFREIISCSGRELFIPKKYWVRSEKRFLTFGEVCRMKGEMMNSHSFEKHGIDVVENTSDEILDAVIEMGDRLKGVWKSSKEEEDLQGQFWDLLKANGTYCPPQLRIGEAFLRENAELLE